MSLKTKNQNDRKTFLKLTNGRMVPAMAAAILDRACDREEEEGRSHDQVTTRQWNWKRGDKTNWANKRPQCIIGQKREREIDIKYVNKGRGSDPGQKW